MMMENLPSTAAIWNALQEVVDPEIPVVSLVEMGIVRAVEVESGGRVIVTITPTFSGCPAQYVMKQDILARLHALGHSEVEVQVTLSPAWTSDWISASGREKLKSFGLAPPPITAGQLLQIKVEAAICPYCGSAETELRNHFGPTLCRAISYCHRCQQPFEQFKPL